MLRIAHPVKPMLRIAHGASPLAGCGRIE